MPEIRVWLTGTTDIDVMKTLREASNTDIVVHFGLEERVIKMIAGYSGTLAYMATPVMAVEIDEFRRLVDDFHRIMQGFEVFLSDREWQNIRSAIIHAKPNLEEVIKKLEDKQLHRPTMRNNSAMVYDILHSYFEIFNPAGVKSLNKTLDDWRLGLTTNHDSQFDTHTVIKNAFDRFEQPQQLSIDDDLYRQKKGEEDIIFRDIASVLPGFDLGQPHGTPIYKMSLLDFSTKRKLTVWMAHRKGKRNSDLLGSDIIYENEINKSMVLIQYKLLTKKKTWMLKIHDKQLEQLLDVCDEQGDCYNKKGNIYIPVSEMRLYDCPVFYKLLSHDVKIEESTLTSKGIYIQACRARQLFLENDSSMNESVIREHGFHLDMFATLLKRSQIGSRANAFDKLRKLRREHMRNDFNQDTILSVAVESRTS